MQLYQVDKEYRTIYKTVKKMAEERSYKVIIETPVPDITLQRHSKRIACNIFNYAIGELELKRQQEFLRIGYNKVIIICSAGKYAVEKINEFRNKFPADDQQAMIVLDPDGFGHYLDQMIARERTVVSWQKGYKVTSIFEPVSPEEWKRKIEVIIRAILNSELNQLTKK